jgi:DNA-directed RNA polymerase specialized sigma subunit
MTPTLDAAIASLLTALRNIEDPVERYEAIRRAEGHLLAAFRSERSVIANNLHEERSWAQVGSMLGVTGSRAEQISRAAR